MCVKKIANTVMTRKYWNRKTTLKLYFSVVSGVTKHIVLPETYKISFFLVKWVCLLCTITVFPGYLNF